MKISGADIQEFWNSWPGWDKNFYLEEGPFDQLSTDLLWTDGSDEGVPIDPARMYNVRWGTLGYQGEGSPPPDFREDLTGVMKAWLKSRTVKSFAVVVPNADVEDFTALCAARGWKTL